MTNKKIVIAGGSGFIGRNIADYFSTDYKIVILTRSLLETENNAYGSFSLKNSSANVRLVTWNGKEQGEWTKEIDGSELVINLAGKSVNCRYTDKNKQEIINSRVWATEAIGEAIRHAVNPPKLWINAASATIYRHATDRPQDEITGEIENDFSVQVCKHWEKALFEQRTPFTRKIALRMAITIGAGGVMVPYFNLIKWGLSGRQGSGKQMYSWVHMEDVCRSIHFLWHQSNKDGVYNISSPNPVTNADFMKKLRKATGTKFGLPATEWMLKIGAFLIGTEPELILKSRWVLPARLLSEGFVFKYADLDSAFRQIISGTSKKSYSFS